HHNPNQPGPPTGDDGRLAVARDDDHVESSEVGDVYTGSALRTIREGRRGHGHALPAIAEARRRTGHSIERQGTTRRAGLRQEPGGWAAHARHHLLRALRA